MKKKIGYLVIILIIICIIPIKSFGATLWEDVIGDGDAFISQGDDPSSVIDTSKLNDLSDDIYNSILLIGMIIAVIVGTVLGVKFMISSIEEKAKIKQILIVYLVGCVVLFGAFTIWKIVIEVLG